ncbi:MAG: hypothetical protein ACR2M0_00905 [Chloroflexia bacterium]
MLTDRYRHPVTFLLLLALGLLAVGLLSLRLASLGPLSFAPDDPTIGADGFYPPETPTGGVRFRWSRPEAGFLLPALAARQSYAVELAAPRPAGVPQPEGISLTANGTSAHIVPSAGFATYTITADSQIGLQNSLALIAAGFTDSFYPSAHDSRLLMLAVRRVSVLPVAGPFGLFWPAPLPGIAALLIPALAFAVARRGWGLLAAFASALLVGIGFWAVPPPLLPAATALVAAFLAICAAALLLLQSGPTLEERLSALLSHPRRGRAAEWVGLTAIFAGLALVATWPLTTRLGDAVPGPPGDNFAFLYKIWWVRTALGSGANLFNDPHVFFPFGFNFGRGEPTLPNTLPGAALAAFFGDAAGYNLVLLAGFVLSGLATYALAREVGCGRGGALIAGVVFMLAPYRLAQASGHLQIAATQWLPLTLLFAERALRRGWRWAAFAGLCYGLNALTAWYYAIIGGAMLGVYMLVRLWQERTTLRARAPGTVILRCTQNLKAFLAFAVVASLVTLPGLVVALGAAGEAPLTHSAKAADENSASLADYLVPNELQPLWGMAAMKVKASENPIESVLYLGVPALLLAGVALLGKRRRAWAWAAAGVVCLVLSLGLTLRVLPGEAVTLGGTPMPMPARLLFDYVPGFNSLRAYARFGGAVALAVAVLSGIGATRLARSTRMGRGRIALTTGLLGFVLLDLWSAPNAWGLTAVAPDAVSGWLSSQSDGGAVMRLPLTAAISGPPLYAGTAYGHPLAYGYETFEPPAFSAARPVLAHFPSKPAFDLLRIWGVRYVVVAASSYGPDWQSTRTYFDGLPDWSRVYQAPQPVRYQAPFWLGDIQPDFRDAFAPDEMVVYRLR